MKEILFAPDFPSWFPDFWLGPGMDSDTAPYAMPTHVTSSVLCLEAEKGAARKRSSNRHGDGVKLLEMVWHRHSFVYTYIVYMLI